MIEHIAKVVDGCKCAKCRAYRVAAVLRNVKKRRDVMRSYKDRPCADCGVSYPYYVMEFDHRGDKEFAIADNAHRVSESKLRNEIAKCDVVCSNCHKARTYIRRQAERGVSKQQKGAA